MAARSGRPGGGAARGEGMKRTAIAVLLVSMLNAQAPAGKVRGLILTGESDTQYHNWRVSTPFLRNLLESTGRFEVKVEEQPAGITVDTLRPFDLIVLNYMGPRWGAGSEAAVAEFVRGGKGILSFHGVTYGPLCGMVFDAASRQWKAGPDEGWPDYASLLGARWKPANVGHGRRHVFPVKWTEPAHPIARGMAPEFVANDELYHRLDLLPGTQVLATAYSDPGTGGTGKDEPIIWTTAFGKGRSVHLTLGHDLAAMSQPGFVAAFARAAEWAGTQQVTLPAVIPLIARQKDAIRVLAVTGGHPYPVSFYTLFEGQEDIVWTHATSPREAFPADPASRYDVLVLHDMLQDLEPEEQEHLRAFVEAGKGVVALHHAIVDYTAWPWWWQEVTGGEFFIQGQPGHPASAYREGVDMVVTATDLGRSHPVTRDIPPLVVNDEAYRGMWHSAGIQVLMETAFPLNDKPVVWVGPHAGARVVYIQLGDSDSTMRYPAYRKLVRNAILWGAGRLN
jgi:uncharacterized protein